MDGLQVSITCLLLKMTFNPAAALLPKSRCPTCLEGYFVEKNCSVISPKWTKGVQCLPCTNCSAAGQDTLVKCSTFADALCGNRSSPAVTSTWTPTEPPVSAAPEVWIILTVITASLFLVLLLALFLTLKSRRSRQQDRPKGLVLL